MRLNEVRHGTFKGDQFASRSRARLETSHIEDFAKDERLLILI